MNNDISLMVFGFRPSVTVFLASTSASRACMLFIPQQVFGVEFSEADIGRTTEVRAVSTLPGITFVSVYSCSLSFAAVVNTIR